MTAPYRTALVGDGAASALLGVQLARALARPGSPPVEIVVIGPHDRLADGAAFGTADRAHLLNVPADAMSAVGSEPGHFAGWLGRCQALPPDAFAPRQVFGDYLRETVGTALERTRGTATLRHLRGQATGIDAGPEGLTIRLDDGRAVAAHSAVLATGLPPAGTSWAPVALRRSARFVPDPWAPRALDAVHRTGDDVLLVGTGLTMVDVALGLCRSADRVVYAVSPSGRLPHRHREPRLPPVPPDITGWGHDLASIQRHARRHIAETAAALGDWRPAVDGLRHRAAALWSRLDEADREAFLRTSAGDWNRMRHRIPVATAADLDRRIRQGRLVVGPGRVCAAWQRGTGLRVTFTDDSTRDVGWVINCTGPQADWRDPLLADLLRPREGGALARPGTAGMGVRTRDGRLLDATGSTRAPLWALGALRRGELWESTAIPEIRGQAERVARAILDEAARHRRLGSRAIPAVPLTSSAPEAMIPR